MSEKPLKTWRVGRVSAAAEEELIIDVQAIRELDAGLALRVLDEPANSAQRDRLSAFLGLHHLVRFLHAHPRWRDAAVSLTKLQSVLGDLEHGYVAPMLSPSPCEVRGRPASSHEKALRNFAAAIMGGLMEHAAMSKSKAAEWVSKRLGMAGYKVAPSTVIDWRQNVLKDKSYLYRGYRDVIDDPAWRSTPALDLAERLVSNLIRLQMQKEE